MDDSRGPDRVVLGYEDGAGSPHVLAELDGRYLSTEVTGGFLGRTIGLYAVGGAAAFDWFDYRGREVAITQRVVMADVASKAGVSVMTVSRVLNDFPGVADETRRRVDV